MEVVLSKGINLNLVREHISTATVLWSADFTLIHNTTIHTALQISAHCKYRIVVLAMDWLVEMCNVGVLLNEHTICYSHNKHIIVFYCDCYIFKRMLVCE